METGRPQVSIVIPNWNGLAHLPDCFEALGKQSFTDFEVIVVDNASSDAGVDWIRRNAPKARVIERPDNGGFAVAVNAGIRASRGDYVALLNNDTAAHRGWLQGLLDSLASTGYDFAASCMVFHHTPTVVNTAGDIFSMRLLAGAQRGRGRSITEYRRPVRVLGASGGAAMYRRDLFDDVGMFDEGFFVLHEDTDLNLRALIAGKRCVYAPDSIVEHKQGASIDRHPSLEMMKISARNQYAVLGKDMPWPLLPLVVLWWGWLTLRSALPARPSNWNRIPELIGRARQRVPAEFAGFRYGLRQRADVWGRRQVPMLEIVRWVYLGVGPVDGRPAR